MTYDRLQLFIYYDLIVTTFGDFLSQLYTFRTFPFFAITRSEN